MGLFDILNKNSKNESTKRDSDNDKNNKSNVSKNNQIIYSNLKTSFNLED